MTQLRVGLVSPGNMGAAVGGRLVRHGVHVVTPEGRTPASQQRAQAAGIALVPEAELAGVDMLFSIVPPGVALATAQQLRPYLSEGGPVFVDWNAISPARVAKVAAIVQEAGARFVDGSIIGLPGALDTPGPLMLASGADAPLLAPLAGYGMRLKLMDRPLGAASALKMSYSGITKGFTALAATMLLAARRAGCDEALIEELGRSQPNYLAGLRRTIPDMFSKAERFAPEMQEIAEFIGSERAESVIYQAIAAFFHHLGEDFSGEQADVGRLGEMVRFATTLPAA